jgi:phenylpropionate dioxygenase-like ring-hydroxylating dioxygenase large terminal subunit
VGQERALSPPSDDDGSSANVAAMSATLPYSAYVDASFLEQERRLLFDRSWHYVGHRGDLPDPGMAIPIDVNGVPIILTRAKDGRLSAMVNVCSHRGSIVCTSPTLADSLRCPYHAWRYALDGTLLAAPRSDREHGFDASTHGLETLPVGLWGPFVFVALSMAAPSFEEFLGDLPNLVDGAGIEVDDLVFNRRSTSDLSANWKVCVENFLECYHCRVAHPGFSKAIDTSVDAYQLLSAPTFSTQYGPVRTDWTGAFDPTGSVGRSQFHLLYPNTTINIMPGEPNLSIGPIAPIDAGTTHRFLDYFFGPEVPQTWIESMIAFDTDVGNEDVELVESVQRGLRARPARTGTLFIDSEKLIADFDDYVRSHLGV